MQADANKGQQKQEINPMDYVYEKQYTCPCCDKEFTNYAIRASKVKHKSSDTDLRNYFEPFDPLYYDTLMCNHCGHTAMNAFMGYVTELQAKNVKEQVTARFIPKEYTIPYSKDDVIERMKFALYTAMAKNVKQSQLANICLKISWLYRDKDDKINESVFQKRALDAFVTALEKESPPIAGMEPDLVTYLVGDLYRRQGNSSEAVKWISRIIANRGIKKSIKDKALEVKELIDASKK